MYFSSTYENWDDDAHTLTSTTSTTIIIILVVWSLLTIIIRWWRGKKASIFVCRSFLSHSVFLIRKSSNIEKWWWGKKDEWLDRWPNNKKNNNLKVVEQDPCGESFSLLVACRFSQKSKINLLLDIVDFRFFLFFHHAISTG